MVNNHGDRKSPKWGYSPYKWPKWLVNRGDPNHLRPSWDDPPSGRFYRKDHDLHLVAGMMQQKAVESLGASMAGEQPAEAEGRVTGGYRKPGIFHPPKKKSRPRKS